MPLILDTFNVLHTVGVLPPDLAGIDVPGLASLVLRSRYRAERVILACDGVPAADLPSPGRLMIDSSDADITIRYSGRGATADDLIRDLINASSAPRRLIVVSSDHEVQRQARRRRCTTLTSQEFLQHLADDAPLARAPGQPSRTIPPAMSEEQVDRWLDVFDVDEESLEAAAAAADLPSDPIAPQPGPKRSGGPGPAQREPADSMDAASSDSTSPAPDPLPADLIADAEALWEREQRSLSFPVDAPPAQTPPTGAPPPAQPTDSQSNDDADLADLGNLDMNAILPRDGQTRPLAKRAKRHRPK